MNHTTDGIGTTDGIDTVARGVAAERLFAAFRALMASRWRPGSDPSRHAEFRVLHLLCDDAAAGGPGIRISALGETLDVKPPTVTRIVDGLEGRGLAARAADPGDRRAALVRPTAEGLALGARMRARALDEFAGLVEDLGPADAETLAALLSRSAAYLERRRADRRGQEKHPEC